jgi:hypothetical protein
MSTPYLRPALLAGFVLVLANAYCGGKVGGPGVVGSADAALPPHAVDASTPNGCPSGGELVALGSACDWTGLCVLSVDPCPAGSEGSASPMPVACADGITTLPPGVGESCSIAIEAGPGTACPDPSQVTEGGACATAGACASTIECGGNPVDCACNEGTWQCPDCGMGSSSGTGSSPGSGDGGTTTCYKPPPVVYPELTAGVYCPFSAADGGMNVTCAAGQACCVPAESAGVPSACISGTTCPVTGSVVVQCEGAPDCAAMPGTVCCGAGIIAEQAPQPGCAAGGGTTPAYSYVTGFKGSSCTAGCAANTFQICSQDSECPSGDSCFPVAPHGIDLGYCGTPSGG